MVRASATGAVESDLISSRVKPMAVKLLFTASLLDAQCKSDSVENKSASLFVVSLGKALIGAPPFWCGRLMAGNSILSELVITLGSLSRDRRINMRQILKTNNNNNLSFHDHLYVKRQIKLRSLIFVCPSPHLQFSNLCPTQLHLKDSLLTLK